MCSGQQRSKSDNGAVAFLSVPAGTSPRHAPIQRPQRAQRWCGEQTTPTSCPLNRATVAGKHAQSAEPLGASKDASEVAPSCVPSILYLHLVPAGGVAATRRERPLHAGGRLCVAPRHAPRVAQRHHIQVSRDRPEIYRMHVGRWLGGLPNSPTQLPLSVS